MKNPLKEKIKNKEVVVGTFLFSSSPVVMEILGLSGLDFVIIDTEHGPTGTVDTQRLATLIRAAETAGTVPLVRIPERDRIMTQKVLDSGAKGIVVPWINTGEEAAEAVAFSKYPPRGVRGACYLTRGANYSIGFTEEYWNDANENTMVVPLIENQEGVDNIKDIITTPGVDFVFFGGRDYSMSMGHPVVNNPDTRNAMMHLEKVCREHDVPLARFLYPPFEESTKIAIKEGFRVLVAGGDVSLLAHASQNLVKSVRDSS